MLTKTRGGYIGFGLQKEQGVPVTPTTWLPGLTDPPGAFASISGPELGETHSLIVPLIPGHLSDLFSWVQHRDSEGRPRLATGVFIDQASQHGRVDVWVRQAVITVRAREFIECDLLLDCRGNEWHGEVTPSLDTTIGYMSRETGIKIALADEHPEPAVDIWYAQVSVDNQPRKDGCVLPDQPDGSQSLQCRGHIAQKRLRAHSWDSALATSTASTRKYGALQMELTRGQHVTTINVPRVAWRAYEWSELEPHLESESLHFDGMPSDDLETPAVVLA